MEPEYPLHPTPGDLGDLERFIRIMPGGDYIGEQWKTEPKVLVSVDVTDYGAISHLLRTIMAAYPPREAPVNSAFQWGRSYLFHVPETVCRMLECHKLVEGGDADGGANRLNEKRMKQLGEVDDPAIDVLMTLWTPDAYFEQTLDEAAERLESIRETAAELEKSFEELLEVTKKFWEESKNATFEEVLEAAGVVIA